MLTVTAYNTVPQSTLRGESVTPKLVKEQLLNSVGVEVVAAETTDWEQSIVFDPATE
jgi:hypothetical protein